MIDIVNTDDVIIMDSLTNEVPNKAELEQMEEIWTKPETEKEKRFTPAQLWNIHRQKRPVDIYPRSVW